MIVDLKVTWRPGEVAGGRRLGVIGEEIGMEREYVHLIIHSQDAQGASYGVVHLASGLVVKSGLGSVQMAEYLSEAGFIPEEMVSSVKQVLSHDERSG
jgi:hypothetical protein